MSYIVTHNIKVKRKSIRAVSGSSGAVFPRGGVTQFGRGLELYRPFEHNEVKAIGEE